MSWLEVRPLRRKKSPVRASRRALAARAVAREVTGSGRWGCGCGAWRAPCSEAANARRLALSSAGAESSGLPRGGNREAGRRRWGGFPGAVLGRRGCCEASPDRARGRECREGSPAERESAGRCAPESSDRARGRKFRRAAEKLGGFGPGGEKLAVFFRVSFGLVVATAGTAFDGASAPLEVFRLRVVVDVIYVPRFSAI